VYVLLPVIFRLVLFSGYIAERKLFSIDVDHAEVSTN